MASNMDDLKAPETLFKNYSEKYMFPNILKSDFTKAHCGFEATDQMVLKKLFENHLLSGTEIDFSICNDKDLPSDMAESCKLNLPSKPTFGVALAILHELHTLLSNTQLEIKQDL
ncbi:hypothetical protein GAMM_10006 [Gammaproteobacteria bacterium]